MAATKTKKADPPQAQVEVDPVTQPFVDFWQSYFQQTEQATRAVFQQFNGNTDLDSWKRQWLEALSRSMDAYMRSPAFLAAMKHNLDTATQTKAHTNDVALEVARNTGVPTASDISGLFERLHSVEDTILSRLNEFQERLDKIDGKLKD